MFDADKWTDKELSRLEKRIDKEYQEAQKELDKIAKDYFNQYRARWDKEHLAMLTSSLSEQDVKDRWVRLYGSTNGFDVWYKTANKAYGKTAIEATAAFQRWEIAQLGRGEHWEALRDQMALRITQSNMIARDYINDVLPTIYTRNNNYIANIARQSAMQQGQTGISFELVDENTVRRLMMSSSEVRPYKPVKISLEKDTNYSKNKLQNALLQGILQGDSIDHIADKFQDAVGMSRASAIKNARTAVTGAQSAGKQDRYSDLADMGCKITKIWVATDDGRTRPEHADADGQEVPYDEYFDVGGEELLYPGDDNGSGWNIYNCRCTMKTGKIVFKSNLDDDTRQKANIRILGEEQEKQEEKVEEKVEEQQEETIEEKEVRDNKEIAQETKDILGSSWDSHIDANGLRAVRYSEQDEIISVDFGNIDARSATVFKDVLADLTSEYDSTLMGIRRMNKEEYAILNNAFASVTHYYDTDHSVLIINPVKFSDHQTMVERITELVGKGFSVQIDVELAEKYVATHEFAHTLLDMETKLVSSRNWLGADYEKIKSTRKEIKAIYDSYLEIYKTVEARAKALELEYIMSPDAGVLKETREAQKALKEITISKYAIKNADEFMAECFTLDRLGVGNEWSDKIMEVINRRFRR